MTIKEGVSRFSPQGIIDATSDYMTWLKNDQRIELNGKPQQILLDPDEPDTRRSLTFAQSISCLSLRLHKNGRWTITEFTGEAHSITINAPSLPEPKTIHTLDRSHPIILDEPISIHATGSHGFNLDLYFDPDTSSLNTQSNK